MGSETMKAKVCNIMQHGNKAFLIHLASSEQVPEFVAHGYTFRGHQLHAAPVKSTTIVVLDRVPYGLPKEAVTNVVAKYGTISGYRAITHKGYCMSKFRLEVDLCQDIPSRINVQGNPINVFYKNQPRSCFVCREAGHEAKNCPRKAGPARPSNQPAGQLSFAAVTAGAKTPVAPSHTDEVLADPPPRDTGVWSATRSRAAFDGRRRVRRRAEDHPACGGKPSTRVTCTTRTVNRRVGPRK